MNEPFWNEIGRAHVSSDLVEERSRLYDRVCNERDDLRNERDDLCKRLEAAEAVFAVWRKHGFGHYHSFNAFQKHEEHYRGRDAPV